MKEKKLIESALKGNARAYKNLYENNVSQLYSFMKQFNSDSDVVADWVQRAFIKAFRKLNQFSGNSKFSTWLFRIAINEMKTDSLKYGKLSFFELDDIAEMPDYVYSNDIDYDHDIKILLMELNEIKRAVFLLVEIEGYTHKEVSEILDISEVLSRTTLHRTKKILKEKLIESGNINE